VTPARNAGEALIFSEKKSFSGFVIDLSLPGLDGFELYERLVGKGRKTPCVFTTGKGRPVDFEKTGDRILLEKPYSPAALVSALNSVMSAQARTAL
jgi:CheY-like chemotaxis protein